MAVRSDRSRTFLNLDLTLNAPSRTPRPWGGSAPGRRTAGARPRVVSVATEPSKERFFDEDEHELASQRRPGVGSLLDELGRALERG